MTIEDVPISYRYHESMMNIEQLVHLMSQSLIKAVSIILVNMSGLYSLQQVSLSVISFTTYLGA